MENSLARGFDLAGQSVTLWDRIRTAFTRSDGDTDRKSHDGFIPITALDRGSAFLPRTNYNYRRDIRQGLDSNVIMAPVNWILRNFTQADCVLERRTKDTWEQVPTHALKRKLDRPNDFYTGGLLWKATLTSYLLDGNAYWRKVRNFSGEVVELWYLPHYLVDPQWPNDGSEFISHYSFQPGGVPGGPERIAVDDIVHLRWGLDPRNPRLGMSQLKPLLREVFTDEDASNFTAAILRNMGVPGLIISPKTETKLEQSEVDRMRSFAQAGFTGDNRGKPFVTGIPTDLQQFGFDPSQLLLANLRDITEERVCAILGIPAAVVGFGAGLQSTKVGATMRELREEAWSSGIEPHQKDLAEQVSTQIIGDFQAQEDRFRVRFDTSGVPALMERNANIQGQLVQNGIQRVDHAQEALGLEVDSTQAGYVRTGALTPANEEPPRPAAPAEPIPPVNGNGRPVNRLAEQFADDE